MSALWPRRSASNANSALALEDVAVFAWDARGHGRSARKRGAASGFDDIVKDLDRLVRHLSRVHDVPLSQMILLGHSLGAVAVAAWVHDYGPPVRGLILATAAFQIRLYLPLAVPALRLQQRVFRSGEVKSYLRPSLLTHDPEEAVRYESDPLIFRQIAIGLLLEVRDAGKRLIADAGAIRMPTLILAAGRDYVVSLKAQRAFYNGLSSSCKQMHVFPGRLSCVVSRTRTRPSRRPSSPFCLRTLCSACTRDVLARGR